jgi:hypothetical protein
MICGNCGHDGLEILDERDGHGRPLVTSDAQLLDAVRAVRTLCPACACIQIHYDPADRLPRFFAAQYDVSDAVQDNLVVDGGRPVGKHTLVKHHGAGLVQRLADRGDVLEIACGSGEWLAWLHDRRPGWRCWGVDPAACAGTAMPPGAVFVRDRFRRETLAGRSFDLIVAHGFLNRAPTLPELRKIRARALPGTLLSLEILTLEDSVFAPFVWDHPFHFRREVFARYLAAAGFAVEAWHDCVSAWNCLARCTGLPVREDEPLAVPETMVSATRSDWLRHLTWWDERVENLRQEPVPAERRAALFGAGLFSAVLHHEVAGDLDFDLVVDDVKAGRRFAGRRVISVAEAAAAGKVHVRLLCRDRYEAAVADQLIDAGIAFTPSNHPVRKVSHAGT